MSNELITEVEQELSYRSSSSTSKCSRKLMQIDTERLYDMYRESLKWTLVDDSTQQHVKKKNQDQYELVEYCEYYNENFYIYSQVIDMRDYDEYDIVTYIKPYGYKSIDEVRKEYGESYKQVIAECIFETDGISEAHHYYKAYSEEEANDFIGYFICDVSLGEFETLGINMNIIPVS
ncbi:hypothetical protein LJB89_04560 [Tyzzerella sp. OttesenSCG-928-J15]|nr:hypothetical protein [Tyzzerella sp. OttesenSCG-928-J15]